MQALKRFVGDISRSQATKRELAREIDTLEKDLEITGATKTMEDLEKELSEAAGKLCVPSAALLMSFRGC